MDPLGDGQIPAEGLNLNTTESQNAANAAMVQNLLNQVVRNSAFNRVPAPMPPPSYSDLMAQAMAQAQAQAQGAPPHLVHLLAQANGLNFLGMPGNPMQMQMPAVEAPPLPSGRGRRTQSGGDGRTVTNNSYASRHQQVSFIFKIYSSFTGTLFETSKLTKYSTYHSYSLSRYRLKLAVVPELMNV